MTSAGNCHVCKKVAYKFHYNTPFNGNGHDGYWYCADHGPTSVDTSGPNNNVKPKDPMHGMNRAERRAFARGKKELA